MFRLICIGAAALAFLALGACARGSDPLGSNGAYTGGQGIRFDQNGNKTYDPTVGDSARTGYADGNRTKREMVDRTLHDAPDRRTDANRASWNDRDVVMINASELPSAARTCMSRESEGAQLSEVGRATWDGKPAYCCKVMKNGHACRVITDADGNLLDSRRLD